MPLAPMTKEAYLANEATDETRPYLDKAMDNVHVFANNAYVCLVRSVPTKLGDLEFIYELCIRRVDRHPIRDWRDLQQIKNEIFGELAEAVELYPSEARLVDHSNVSYLYVLPAVVNEQGKPVLDGAGRPLYRSWPFGFLFRLVSEKPLGRNKQRSFPADRRPHDLREMTVELVKEYAKATQAAHASPDPHPTVFQLQNAPKPVVAFLREALAHSLPALEAKLGIGRVEEIFQRIADLVLRRKEVQSQAPTAETLQEAEELAVAIENYCSDLDKALQPASGPTDDHTWPADDITQSPSSGTADDTVTDQAIVGADRRRMPTTTGETNNGHLCTGELGSLAERAGSVPGCAESDPGQAAQGHDEASVGA